MHAIKYGRYLVESIKGGWQTTITLYQQRFTVYSRDKFFVLYILLLLLLFCASATTEKNITTTNLSVCSVNVSYEQNFALCMIALESDISSLVGNRFKKSRNYKWVVRATRTKTMHTHTQNTALGDQANVRSKNYKDVNVFMQSTHTCFINKIFFSSFHTQTHSKAFCAITMHVQSIKC